MSVPAPTNPAPGLTAGTPAAGRTAPPATGGRRGDERPPLRVRLAGRQPIGMLLSLPYAVYVAVIFAYPLGFAIWMSFHHYFFTAPGVSVPHPFVGLQNYKTVLTDPDVLASFGHVGIFLIINVPLTVVLSLTLAAALNRGIRGQTFFRVSYYIPYVTASVAVVGVWLFLFNTDGLVNNILGPLAPSPSWLISSTWAMPMIAVFVTWKQLGFFILLYLAALQNVPKELYESASTDGANGLQSFLSVTVPGVRTATGLVTLLAIVTGANLFTEPYLLTGGGGPAGASTTPVLLIYQKGIQQAHPDVASALGVILVIVVLIIGLANLWLNERGNK